MRKQSCFDQDRLINEADNPDFASQLPIVPSRRKIHKNNHKKTNISNLKKVNISSQNNLMFPIIYFANARSMNNKEEELEQIKETQADIVITTETWLNSDYESHLFSN